MKNKFSFKIVLGMAVTAVMIYMAARALGGLNPLALFRIHINWWFFLAAVLVFGAGQYLRAFVYPFGIDRRLTLGTACRIVLVGNMANMLLPLRLGEGIRFAFFPRLYNAQHRTRLLMEPGGTDVVVILLLSVLAVPLAAENMHPQTVHMLKIVAVVLAALAAVLLLGILLLPGIRRMASRYLTPGFARMAGWIFCSWVLILVSTWIGLLAFRFPDIASVRMAFSVFATSNIILFVPSSPGGLGVFEYAVVLSLSFFGVPEPAAVSAALLLHLVQYAALLPMGAVAYLTGLSLRRAAPAALRKGA